MILRKKFYKKKNRSFTRWLKKTLTHCKTLPATTESFLMARLTIIMASCRDLSVSSMNCSAPPRMMMVQVLALGQPRKMLYLQNPYIIQHGQFITIMALWSQTSWLALLNSPFTSNLHLLKVLTDTQNISSQAGHCGLDGTTTSLHCPLQILLFHTASTEHVPVRYLSKQSLNAIVTHHSKDTHLSAKYWVATSPIGSFESTTLAPLWWIFSNLS